MRIARFPLLIAIAILALSIAAIMHRWLFYAGVPVTFRGENVPEINYAWLIRQQMEAGHPFALWLPKFIGGEAVATHAAYPLYWLMALVSWLFDWPMERLYIWAEYSIFLIGALGTLVLVRRLTGQLAAGVVAGSIFSLIPAHLNAIEGFYLQCSWMLIPWAFWLVEQRCALQQPLRTRHAVAPGVLLGILFLLSIQMPMMMVPYLVLYLAVREWQTWRAPALPRFPRNWWQDRGRIWLLSGLIGVGLSLSYYLPTTIDLFQLGWSRYVSDQLGLTIDLSFLWFMLHYRWSSEMTPIRWHHISWYLGGVTVILAVLGWLSHPRKSLVWFYLGLALFSLLLLVGNSLAGIPNWVYHAVEITPFFNGVLRRAFRFILPVSFFLAILAGFGVATLLRWLRIRRLWTSLLIAALLSGAILTDYWLHRGDFRIWPNYLEPERVALVEWLNQQQTDGGYLIPFEYGKTDDGYLRSYHLVAMHHLIERPGIWDDSFVGHYASRRADELMQICIIEHPLWSKTPSPILDAMLDLANVRYYILHSEVPEQQEMLAALEKSDLPLVFSQGALRVFENRNVRPFIQFYASAIRYGGTNLAGEFQDWLPLTHQRNLVLFDGEQSAMSDMTQFVDNVATLTALAAVAQPSLESSWQQISPGRIQVQTKLAQPTHLVVAQSWFPGWRVRVDGVQQPLYRANYAFMGVQLAAGEHTVEFSYRPPWYTWVGWTISALIWLLAAWLRLRR